MSVNLEQAKRLKVAGYVYPSVNMVWIKWLDDTWELLKRDSINFQAVTFKDIIHAPDEKEMMEFLKKHEMFSIECNLRMWRIRGCELEVEHSDITSALVQACCRVLEERKGK